jgi:hypothetical protein
VGTRESDALVIAEACMGYCGVVGIRPRDGLEVCLVVGDDPGSVDVVREAEMCLGNVVVEAIVGTEVMRCDDHEWVVICCRREMGANWLILREGAEGVSWGEDDGW